MGLGVLEDHRTPFPPGTVLLDDIYRPLDPNAPEFAALKKKGHVILQPQPSDSINDPLNWSNKHKVWLIGILLLVMVTMGGTAMMLGTALRILSERFHVPYQEVIRSLSAPALIANAFSLWICSALAAVYGKRVLYVVSMPILWINLLVGFWFSSLDYIKGISVVGGLFGAPLELLFAPIITDLIFIHQRGKLMALSSIMSVVGGDIASIVAGNIVQYMGPRYTFLIAFAVVTPMVVLIYLFVWETTYTRPVVAAAVDPLSVETKEAHSPTVEYDGKGLGKPQVIMSEDLGRSESNFGRSESNFSPTGNPAERKLTFRQRLKVFHGRVTDRSFFKSLLQPFPLMIFPSVLYSTIVNGAFVTWMMASGLIAQLVLLYAPYNLKPSTLAYIGLPGSGIALISAVAAGAANDWLAVKLAHRNNGVYEPEFRLIMMIPATILSTLGFFLAGDAYHKHAPLPTIIGIGLCFYAAGPMAGAACINYIFDTQGKNTTEAMVATTLCKMLLGFFALQFVPGWYYKVGPIKVFHTLGWLNLAFCLLTIPMYVFGKKFRGMSARSKFLMKHTIVQ